MYGRGYGYPPINPMLPQERYNPAANLYGPMAGLRPLDRDGDGMITQDDFVIANRERGLGYMGDVMARSSFNALDYNHNGRLDYMEAARPAYYGPRYY